MRDQKGSWQLRVEVDGCSAEQPLESHSPDAVLAAYERLRVITPPDARWSLRMHQGRDERTGEEIQ